MNRKTLAPSDELTVIIPAFKESGSVGDTIKRLQDQTNVPSAVIIVDDCASASISTVAARSSEVIVVRPPQHTGSKARARNYALPMVKTELVMAIDPNAKLLATAIEKLGTAFKDSNVVAASDMVIPRYVFTHWESGRYVESILTYTFYKQVRNYYQKPVISSGCFSMYRTKVLQAHGGWPPRTLAEDIDLTWSLYQIGYKVCFISLCDPVSDGAP